MYRPLTEAGEAILDTVVAYLDSGRALESTARPLFVHTNTVRYRLRRAAELCGRAPTEARGAFTIQLALVLGRLAGPAAPGRPLPTIRQGRANGRQSGLPADSPGLPAASSVSDWR